MMLLLVVTHTLMLPTNNKQQTTNNKEGTTRREDSKITKISIIRVAEEDEDRKNYEFWNKVSGGLVPMSKRNTAQYEP